MAAPPTVDGRLDDPAWETVEWSGDFVQREPAEGGPPSQETELKVSTCCRRFGQIR